MKEQVYDLIEVKNAFLPDAEFEEALPFGGGHINDTYKLKAGGGVYTVQRINHNVFKKPWQVMENIVGVTGFICDKLKSAGIDPSRRTLHFMRASDGNYFYKDSSGNYWRTYPFIDKARSYQALADAAMFFEVGSTFGHFQRLLSDYPAETLHETIPMFHDTVNRLENLKNAAKADAAGRLSSVQPELEALLSREALASELKSGYNLPKKVTHNDTKVNNVLVDDATGKGICVIDLDTVMPGYAAYDFGDAVRVGASTAEEDEKNLDLVDFNCEYYEAFAHGFVQGTGGMLSKDEIASLPVGARLMTYENGLRFLTDYLDGDVYFKTAYPEHNLVRCRTQIRLLSKMDENWDVMRRAVV